MDFALPIQHRVSPPHSPASLKTKTRNGTVPSDQVYYHLQCSFLFQHLPLSASEKSFSLSLKIYVLQPQEHYIQVQLQKYSETENKIHISKNPKRSQTPQSKIHITFLTLLL